MTARPSRREVLAHVRTALSGDPGLTMDALAVGAGVSRAWLYAVFGSRDGLVAEAGISAPPPLRERVLRAGAEVLAEGGLVSLSVDGAAQRAGVSRAVAFRLFPGKGALFQELVRTYVPMAETVELLRAVPAARPEGVMAEVAAGLLGAGPLGVGVLRATMFEPRRDQAHLAGALHDLVVAYRALADYLEAQMAAGNLRPMHPYLALQLFVAPIVVHLCNQDVVAERVGFTMSTDEAAAAFTRTWLRAMRPPRTRRRP